MRYATVCSGIEAPSVAAEPLGWIPVWFSEIEKFPCKVLAHHYPDVPNLGDMTKITEQDIEQHGPVDVFVGGTPCQSFSVAGARSGLADPRGNLAFDFLRIASIAKPEWIVWENVPGVLSSGRGRDFGSFLGAMAELGYGWAYRVLDSQYTAAQTRSRVYVVGCSGYDTESAAQVLAVGQGEGVHPAENRGGEVEGEWFWGCNRECVSAITRNYHRGVHCGGESYIRLSPLVTHQDYRECPWDDEEICCDRHGCPGFSVCDCIGMTSEFEDAVYRRLTPTECERLQGFPDNYTLVPGASDTARYKAIGNSMTVPVIRDILTNINTVQEDING